MAAAISIANLNITLTYNNFTYHAAAAQLAIGAHIYYKYGCCETLK
jgi:hypothetical protein